MEVKRQVHLWNTVDFAMTFAAPETAAGGLKNNFRLLAFFTTQQKTSGFQNP